MSRTRPGSVALIAALGSNRVIGAHGNMPWHLPQDLRHFKATTLGAPLLMGRKTFDSIGRALPGRRTVVITRQGDWRVEGVECAASLDCALQLVADAPIAYIAGGGEIYAQALPLADTMILTWVDAAPDGDTFFPDFPPQEWDVVDEQPGEGLRFVTYRRRSSATPAPPAADPHRPGLDGGPRP